MSKIPTLSSTVFDWTAKSGYTTLDKIGCGVYNFPDRFYIKSARTGEVRLFLPDEAVMEAHDFFDGEGAAYMVPGQNIKVQIWH